VKLIHQSNEFTDKVSLHWRFVAASIKVVTTCEQGRTKPVMYLYLAGRHVSLDVASAEAASAKIQNSAI